MKTAATSCRTHLASAAAVIMLLVSPGPVEASGKLGIYGLRMTPNNTDATDFSEANWGGGAHLVVPVRQVANLLAGTAGLEYIHFFSETVEFRDPHTLLRVEQQTSQNCVRLYLGGQAGGHGHGFLRPHAGMNVALHIYSISTDVVVPDDSDRENEIRQHLDDRTETTFGYDVTLGVDLNFRDRFSVDGGVRYIKSFNLPQQLGEGSETIHPDYFQVYLGIGVSFETLSRAAKSKREE